MEQSTPYLQGPLSQPLAPLINDAQQHYKEQTAKAI